MAITSEAISLLHEMIDFAKVDGVLHDKELTFIYLIASELGISKSKLEQMFITSPEKVVVKDEFERICQFYRLVLLMNADGEFHAKETQKINEIGITMGLNPHAMKRVIEIVKKNKNKTMAPEKLFAMFTEQLN